jgi:hypothetical protein
MPKVTREFTGLALAACCAAALLAEPAWPGVRRGAEQAPVTEPERQGVRSAPAPGRRGVRTGSGPAPRGARPAPPPGYDVPDWNYGYWYHGGYRDYLGWWWIVGPRWYFVSSLYPYWERWPPTRVVVIERPEPDGTPPPAYWYRCADPGGYYPSVSECPGGWTPVPATPPDAKRK